MSALPPDGNTPYPPGKTPARRGLKPWQIVLIVLAGILFTGFMIWLGNFYVQIALPTIRATLGPTSAPKPTQDLQSYRSEADRLYQQGRLVEAIAAYQKLITQEPGKIENYLELAKIQVLSGQWEAAQRSSQNALLLDPQNAYAKALLGWALTQPGGDPQARSYLEKAVLQAPDNPQVLAFYAENLAYQGEPALLEQALAVSLQALELAPERMETHRARAIVLLAAGDPQAALDELQQAIQIHPNLYELYYLSGRAYRELGQEQQAQAALLTSCKRYPGHLPTLLELAESYTATGQTGEALRYARIAVSAQPEDPRLHGRLGIILYQLGDIATALSELELAVLGGTTKGGVPVPAAALTPTTAENALYYGLALAQSGRCEEAVRIFNALLSTFPQEDELVRQTNDGLAICQK